MLALLLCRFLVAGAYLDGTKTARHNHDETGIRNLKVLGDKLRNLEFGYVQSQGEFSRVKPELDLISGCQVLYEYLVGCLVA
jgi:hypothetical protein